MEATHRLLGHTAWLVLVVAAGGGVAALVRAGRGRQLTAEGRAVLAVGDRRGRHRAARLRGLAALARVGDALPRDRRPAVPAAVAAGLAAARGLGMLGLVIVAILWAYDVWPTTKSNVRQVAAAIGPSLPPGDVVVSTQPEQVPVLHHYLPPGLRYATLTGYVKDVGVTDWRDGVERLRASSPQRDLKPILDALAPGRRLVLVHADHLRHGPLERAVDQARAAALGGVQPVREQRRALPRRRRSTRRSRARAGRTRSRRPCCSRRALAGSGRGSRPGRRRRRPRERGSESVKRVPPPGRSASVSVPPMRSASSRPIARPSPKPPSEPRARPR